MKKCGEKFGVLRGGAKRTRTRVLEGSKLAEAGRRLQAAGAVGNSERLRRRSLGRLTGQRSNKLEDLLESIKRRKSSGLPQNLVEERISNLRPRRVTHFGALLGQPGH